MAVVIKRFDVLLIHLDPKVGSEIKKTRPYMMCLPDTQEHHAVYAVPLKASPYHLTLVLP